MQAFIGQPMVICFNELGTMDGFLEAMDGFLGAMDGALGEKPLKV